MTLSFAANDRSTDHSADAASPERIAELTEQLVVRMQSASKTIRKVNDQARLLSFNAQIEAARTGGAAGAAFAVVASAMRDLSEKTAAVSINLEDETILANESLQNIIENLSKSVRGVRLSTLALTNIDLIDRNLYERSCDVRWWATDSSPVDALSTKTDEAYRFCSRRFGIILNSYTVYYDLVLCNLNGEVVCNGRPEDYRSVGSDCSQSDWFTSALATKSGEEYGFQTVHNSSLVNGERVLIYSCCVREGGDVNGKIMGVLGIVFNWDALAETIVRATPLSPDERAKTRVCICDKHGMVLADTAPKNTPSPCSSIDWNGVKTGGTGFLTSKSAGTNLNVGFALSPGYETYKTGWYSLLVQS